MKLYSAMNLNFLRYLSLITACLILEVVCLSSCSFGQTNYENRNVILITLDGLRSEEVFNGADQRLMVKENGVEDPSQLEQQFWRESPKERREILLPFLWERCSSEEGWIAGDLNLDSVVSVTNDQYFSYPGYNEILTGAADPKVDSNDKKYNTNISVLEWLHRKEGFQNRIAAYCSWDVFPFIINDRRSGIPVNAGWMPLTVGDPAKLEAYNFVAQNMFHEWEGVRYDAFTAAGAIEELTTNHPRVLYVSLGETDDWAHKGRYDRYLLAAQQNDAIIRKIWETSQSIPQYQNKTLYLIATDHGRGDGREGWKSHGSKLPGSEHIWLAAFGPGLSATGIDEGNRYQQAQVAATVADYLGFDFPSTNDQIAAPLPMIKHE